MFHGWKMRNMCSLLQKTKQKFGGKMGFAEGLQNVVKELKLTQASLAQSLSFKKISRLVKISSQKLNNGKTTTPTRIWTSSWQSQLSFKVKQRIRKCKLFPLYAVSDWLHKEKMPCIALSFFLTVWFFLAVRWFFLWI